MHYHVAPFVHLAALLLAFAGCAAAQETQPDRAALMDPESEAMTAQAPDTFDARFTTTAGEFVIRVHREWAPRGADRFYNLVRHGFYDDQRFFRVLPGFVAQWGIPGDPALSRVWRTATIDDDPVEHSNSRGTVVFATSGPDSRTTQLFVNLADNRRLDAMGFAPFGEVIEGLPVVESLYSRYGEAASQQQQRIQREGNAFLDEAFPELDQIETAAIMEDEESTDEQDGQD